MDFRGFDSSIILIIRGGILRPIGDAPESLTQAMLVGEILVGRMGAGKLLELAWEVESSRKLPSSDIASRMILLLLLIIIIMILIIIVIVIIITIITIIILTFNDKLPGEVC